MTWPLVPELGRIVLFHDLVKRSAKDEPRAVTVPGIITAVHSDSVVDLSVFAPHSDYATSRISVVKVGEPDEDGDVNSARRWSWPPRTVASARAFAKMFDKIESLFLVARPVDDT